MTSDNDLLFFVADEDGVTDLFRGLPVGKSTRRETVRLRPGQFGILGRVYGNPPKIKPVVALVDTLELKRFFGRFASLRNEYSPISSWCHVIDPSLYATTDRQYLHASIGSLEASWAGLAIAEARLLSRLPLSSLSISACLATATFAIGRSAAIWPQIPIEDVTSRLQRCGGMIRGSGAPSQFYDRMMPIWTSMVEATSKRLPTLKTTRAMLKFQEFQGVKDIGHLSKIMLSDFDGFRGLEIISRIDEIKIEDRVAVFDNIVKEAENAPPPRRNDMAFIAGFLVNVAAGGQSSIGLAEKVFEKVPEVLAWAHVIGGLGEHVTWNSSFDGLGRFVARELTRPVHLDEDPSCDFSFDELIHLYDPQLNNPLVNLKIKQQRSVSVALYPGVHTTVPLQPEIDNRPSPTRSTPSRSSRELNRLFNDLWPLFEAKLKEIGVGQDEHRSRPTQRHLFTDK